MYETNVLCRNRKKTGEKEFGIARSPHHAKEISADIELAKSEGRNYFSAGEKGNEK